MERETFIASDGKKLSVAVWKDNAPHKAAVVIAHGMAEHIARYDEFASYLNSRGYLVVGDDHRAHGMTDRDRLGLAGDADLFEDSVRDIKELVAGLRERGYRTALVGHSYGSFLSQRFLSNGAGADLFACALIGSALQRGPAVALGRMLAKSKMKRKKDLPGKMFVSLTFGSYDKKFKEGAGAWLNSDRDAVSRYNDDPLNGFVCSNGFYYYFFNGLRHIARDKHAPLNGLPVLVMSGSDDPVGNFGKSVKKLAARLEKEGGDVNLRLVNGARHEVLNEPTRQSAYELIADFLNGALEKQPGGFFERGLHYFKPSE